jgi:hypothetical protein
LEVFAMAKDQVELLTRDAKHVLDSLPVKERPTDKIIKDTLVHEAENPPPPGESPGFQAFMTGLTWAGYALIIGAGGILFLITAESALAPFLRP